MAATSPQNPTLAQIDHAHGHDQSGHIRTYWKVFTSLAIFTAIEYFYAQIFASSFAVLVLGLMTWAIIKAVLVGLYFMHLKYEGKWVYAMLVPAGVLACVLVLALTPDIAMQPVVDMNAVDDDTEDAPSPSRITGPAISSTAPAATPAHAEVKH